ncbi:hypothetical protein RMSM_00675 [Rhodopirellula maiorica SM1]|uniref:Uncharacterized protein n=1 Tax=Rhodopirellula maiorica SM1 TaxID=1265738 RepID=M5RSZ0_9BACT|nr:hypothetical protein RMSM_00675 [Rhodopirellula maiorica SM1]
MLRNVSSKDSLDAVLGRCFKAADGCHDRQPNTADGKQVFEFYSNPINDITLLSPDVTLTTQECLSFIVFL